MVTVATFTSIINQLLPEPHAGLLAGILFGTKATLSKSLYQDLVTTGTLHIVALSGMNITIIASLVSLTLLRFVSRRIASLLTILMIIGFVWFVGFSPSIIRAAIMGTISLLAVIFGKQKWALFSWALAVGIMLLINIGWLIDISFQLSALATLGIILFAGTLRNDFPREDSGQAGQAGSQNSNREDQIEKKSLLFVFIRVLYSFVIRVLKDDLRTTLAAQVFTIPIILFHFHRISIVSPLSNVLIGWMIAPVTIIGLLTVLLGVIWLPLGQIFAWASWVFLEYLLQVVTATSRLPFASFGL